MSTEVKASPEGVSGAVSDPTTLTAEELCCPLLGAIGAEDQNPSPELGEQLRERASASRQPVQIDVYAGAGHAFFADYRPNYRPHAAAKLWQRIAPFLADKLGTA
jgi:carboxymethylenebutenolidase